MVLHFVAIYDKDLQTIAEHVRDASVKDAVQRVLGTFVAQGATGAKIYRFTTAKAVVVSDGNVIAACVAATTASDAFLTTFMGNVLTLPTKSASIDASLNRLVEQFAGQDLTSGEKFDALSSDLDKLRSSALDNVRLLLDRGEKIDVIVDRTDQLVTNTQTFRRSASSLKKAKQWQVYQGWLLMGGLAVVGLLVYLAIRKA